jgi:hypothetical protein
MSKITKEESDFIVRFLTLVIMCLPDVGKILKNKKSGNAFIYRLNQRTQAMTKAEKRQFLKWFAQKI